MDCRSIQARLGAYRDGELTPTEAGEVSEHLARCTRCRALSRQFGQMGELIRSASTAEAPPFFEARFWAALAGSGESTIRGRTRWPTLLGARGALVTAGAMSLAVLVSLPFLLRSDDPAMVAHGGPEPTVSPEVRLVGGGDGLQRAPDEPVVPESWGPGTRIEGFWTQESEDEAPSRYLVGEVSSGARLQRASF